MTERRMPDLIDELSAIAQECKNLLTELRQERRGVKQDLADLAERRAEFLKLVDNAIDQEQVVEVIRGELQALKDKIDEVGEKKLTQVGNLFDQMLSTILYGNTQGRDVNVMDELYRKFKRGEL